MGASDVSYNDLDWEMRQIYNNQVGREAQLKLIKYLGADSLSVKSIRGHVSRSTWCLCTVFASGSSDCPR